MSGEERHADETRRIAEDGTEYHCQAYGPEAGDLCFCQASYPCTSREMCERVMTRERMILWVRLCALEAMGDETAKFVLDGLDHPGQLLNGDLEVRAQADEEGRKTD